MGDLEMKVVETHRTPLSRQVHEGVAIETNTADIIMNSKTEWNQLRLPRIVIEDLVEEEESGQKRTIQVNTLRYKKLPYKK